MRSKWGGGGAGSGVDEGSVAGSEKGSGDAGTRREARDEGEKTRDEGEDGESTTRR